MSISILQHTPLDNDSYISYDQSVPAYDRILSAYYDSLITKYDHITKPLDALIKTYHPQPKRICEIGCGTGNILQHFLQDGRELSGVDVSKDMLTVARNKIPTAHFYQADASNFHIDQKFDLILSMYDTINHLTTFKEWTGMFASVAKHLDKKGLFIFDLNLDDRFRIMASMPPVVKYMGNDFVIRQVKFDATRKLYDFQFHIFQKQKQHVYTCYEKHIYETSFPLSDIKRALRNHFMVKEILSIPQEKLYPKSRRIMMVCKKKDTL